MKIAFLWSGISGYAARCWQELGRRPGIDVLAVTCQQRHSQTQFSTDLAVGFQFLSLGQSERNDRLALEKPLAEFHPDALFVSGWFNTEYMRLAMSYAKRNCPVIVCMDNPRRPGSLRQFLGRYKFARYFRLADGVFIPGERGWQFARYLGFPEYRIWRGLYGIDFDGLKPLVTRRRQGQWPRRFLFVGQICERKGIIPLIDAYRRYRQSVDNPWPLRLCGIGPLSDRVRDIEGIELQGFVQPAALHLHLAEAGVFVLPSLSDPWPLAIVEACAAGLPVICTQACGSSVELVRSFQNGLVCPTGDESALTRSLCWMHAHSDQLPTMGEYSVSLASAYSSQRWADRVISLLDDVQVLKRDGAPRLARWGSTWWAR